MIDPPMVKIIHVECVVTTVTVCINYTVRCYFSSNCGLMFLSRYPKQPLYRLCHHVSISQTPHCQQRRGHVCPYGYRKSSFRLIPPRHQRFREIPTPNDELSLRVFCDKTVLHYWVEFEVCRLAADLVVASNTKYSDNLDCVFFNNLQ